MDNRPLDRANQMTPQIEVQPFSLLGQRQLHQVHQRQRLLLSRQDHRIVAKTTDGKQPHTNY